jgi:hypothetical protein
MRPLWWDRGRLLFAAGLNWQWTIRKGRRDAQMFPGDYIEIHYEGLVTQPGKSLKTLAEFLEHDLDYARIQEAGIGRVNSPNTSWKEEDQQGLFSPIDRWKTKLSSREIAGLEMLIGDSLEEFGYSPATKGRRSHADPRLSLMRLLYPRFFDAKLSLKSNTPLGRFASTNPLQLTEAR